MNTGEQCERVVDLCVSQPCQYGGVCSSGHDFDLNRPTLTCDCPDVTSGQFCEHFEPGNSRSL